jgi:hypothetical protein
MTEDTTTRLPVTMCWHCDRPLDAASDIEDPPQQPHEGAISLCMYCGAVARFGEDLRLEPPDEALLEELQDNPEFRRNFTQFCWARQFVMIKSNLMRDRGDEDR